MNFYKHFLGDYARDTAHLSMLEHAAYRLLLDHYYATEHKLPVPVQCERICRATTEEEKAAVRSVLNQFFKSGVNGRADREIKQFKDYGEAQAMRAHMRWQSKGNASHSHSHKPDKNKPPIAPLALPDWLNVETWKSYVQSRPARSCKPESLKAALSKLEAFRAAGHDPNEIVATSLANGWQMLKEPEVKGRRLAAVASERPSIVCSSCGQKAFTWTSGQCDPCWRKEHGYAAA